MQLPADFRRALIDRYEITTPIAEGATASIFLANDHRHGRRVALKVLRPDASVAFSDVRFVREIKFLAHLQHPNILALYDSGLAAGLLYYVMPYVPGETLRARLDREKKLPLRTAVRGACELAGAVDYAHRHGIIHRDIKPENILLAETHVLLMDFGIARALGIAAGEQLTSPLTVGPGTPTYMSPEQFIPGQELDGRSDIYSMGAVFYEVVSGEPPFRAGGGRAALMRKLSEPAPSLLSVAPEIPPAVATVVARALATDPDERFASAAEFANALESASAKPSPVVSARGDARDVATARRSAIPRGVWIAVALVAAVLVLAAGRLLLER
jgi:serine/threonine protein kinase